jgi:hypothetical protein
MLMFLSKVLVRVYIHVLGKTLYVGNSFNLSSEGKIHRRGNLPVMKFGLYAVYAR